MHQTGSSDLNKHNLRLMITVIVAAYLLIAVSNGIDWISRAPAAQALDIAAWEFLYNGSACITNIAICLIYARLFGRAAKPWLYIAPPILCFVGGALWITIAHFVIKLLGLPHWIGVPMSWISLTFQGGLASGTTLFLVSCVAFGLDYWRQAALERENAREAKSLAHQAQLRMLRYQLNPHFLFNTLNAIRGLILEDPQRSRRMVSELADFLRYSLDGRASEGTVGDELEAIENYLAIQRTRFEHQLDAEMQADPSALSVALPSFLIHPLVENAVKHGMKTGVMPLKLRIEITRRDQTLNIRVSNSGQLVPKHDHSYEDTGIGLKNITERLELAFPARHNFRLEEKDGWVTAEIELLLTATETQA
ncbi:sensor histidine kinase [Rhizomicrobium palustre]|nr:histidine kinase [Rhizomicrobium palustre]